MKRPIVLLAVSLLAAVALAMAACGGGDGDETEPSSTRRPESTTAASPAAAETVASPEAAETGAAPTEAATVEDSAEVEELLKAASLQLEDLPEGFVLDEDTYTTNEEASVEADGVAQPTLEDFNSWGRILGYDATYSDPEALTTIEDGGTLSLTVTTTLYEDSDGAGDALDYVRNQADDSEFIESFEETFASPGVEIQDAGISPLSLAELGDDREAYEIKVTMHSTDLDEDFEFIAQLFGIRRDRLLGAVTVVTVNASPSEDQLEDLASKLDERMNDALE